MKHPLAILISALALTAQAAVYTGRVVDQNGAPVAYATVYPEIIPELGTATNMDGCFTFECAALPPATPVVVSFIGYQKQIVQAGELHQPDSQDSTAVRYPLSTIRLIEQPIALEETVVAAKASKQKNRRKQMAALLHAVYVQLEADFPDEPARYQVVSDVKMQTGGDPQFTDSHAGVWGMEQMIANIVVLPESAGEGRDSIQFQGRFCKRFFSVEKRAQADSILASDMIERMEKGQKEKFMRRAANAVDSGVVVHEALFAMGNMRYDFEQSMTDLKHWTVSNESEGETVLTHTQKVSRYLGLFQLTFSRHYIVDSETYAVRRFSEHAEAKVTIPFGYKLNADQLQMLNLLNMGESHINRFRLRKLNAVVDYNTIYQRPIPTPQSSVIGGHSPVTTPDSPLPSHVYTLEKNMHVRANILGSKNTEMPLVIKATQRVIDLQTTDVVPLTPDQITRRVPRQIVEIY